MKRTIVIEPFYGGSHKQLIDLFKQSSEISDCCEFFVLPAKKWHWRARTSALHFANVIPKQHNYWKLFCTSTLNLTELIGLRPDLSQLHKILYFHENQLIYPINREKSEFDFHYGYMQIISCLTADKILFNSGFNLRSFLQNIDKFVKFIPSDSRIQNLSDRLAEKCEILYFPMIYPELTENSAKNDENLHIVWAHRWEHDKNPELFFQTLFRLKNDGLKFAVSVLGENFNEKPKIFDEAKEKLAAEIRNWGFVDDKFAYFKILRSAHIAVSTADHEFFGVSMLEAAYCGCFPICPKALSYLEIYPAGCLYSTEDQLFKLLRNFCRHPRLAVGKYERLRETFDFDRFSWTKLKDKYANFLTAY